MPRNPTGLVRFANRPGYYYRDQRGGKDRLVKLSNDREAALSKLRELRGDAPLDPVTVKDAASSWLRSSVALHRKPKSLHLAGQRVRDFLTPALGYRRLTTLTANHCREYRMHLERRGLSPQTVAHVLADLRCLLLWAAESDLLLRSPFPRRLLPKIPKRPPEHLSEDEVSELEALPEPYGFYLQLLIGTGMRWEEATRARSTDLEGDVLVIPESKSGKARRVPLDANIVREIRSRVGRLMHVTSNGSFNRRIKRVVPRFHAHVTRHTFAIRYLERGGTVHGLQYLLGHASIATTMLYLRGLPEHAEREARQVVGRG